LIGPDGEQRITAEELARRLQTINYEITCALTPRVARVYHRDGLEADPIAAGAGLAARGEPAWLPARYG
jgi:alanine racemase